MNMFSQKCAAKALNRVFFTARLPILLMAVWPDIAAGYQFQPIPEDVICAKQTGVAPEGMEGGWPLSAAFTVPGETATAGKKLILKVLL